MTCRVLCALAVAFVCAASPAGAAKKARAPHGAKVSAIPTKASEKVTAARVATEKPSRRDAKRDAMPTRKREAEPVTKRAAAATAKSEPAKAAAPGKPARTSPSTSRSRAKSDTLAERLRSDEPHARPEPTPRSGAKGKAKSKETASPARPKRRVRAVPENASWRPYRRPPWRRGYVTLFGHGKRWSGYLAGPEGEVPPASRKSLSRVLASWRTGNQILIDEGLIRLIADVSDEFGGRPIRIVSGYRERSYAPDSKHKSGEAFDFSVPGVPNEALRDFLRSLGRVGVGYYPNSTHVHLDVRDKPTYWVDYSFPGSRPAYTTDRRVARWGPRERAIADALDAIRVPPTLTARPAPVVPPLAPPAAPADRKPVRVPIAAGTTGESPADRTRAVGASADAGAPLDAGAASADGGAHAETKASGGNGDAGDGARAGEAAADAGAPALTRVAPVSRTPGHSR